MRQSPRGIFCDGINKILLPERPRTAVVVTGYITLQDTSKVTDSELCDFLAKNPAPIDFGRYMLEFLNARKTSFSEPNWRELVDRIHNEIQPYIKAGNLNPFFGTRIAQIVVAEFEPDTLTSGLINLGVDLDGSGRFVLQPIRVTAATTVRGDSFGPQSDQVILPSGEVAYFRDQVLAGVGKQFLSNQYFEFLKIKMVADIDPEWASSVALNLINAASKATEMVSAPSGIGGGASAVVLSTETRVLK
jgi:hypothetical protein